MIIITKGKLIFSENLLIDLKFHLSLPQKKKVFQVFNEACNYMTKINKRRELWPHLKTPNTKNHPNDEMASELRLILTLVRPCVCVYVCVCAVSSVQPKGRAIRRWPVVVSGCHSERERAGEEGLRRRLLVLISHQGGGSYNFSLAWSSAQTAMHYGHCSKAVLGSPASRPTGCMAHLWPFQPRVTCNKSSLRPGSECKHACLLKESIERRVIYKAI